MLHFQYTRNCSIGHFFPLFLPPTYEWPRPTVLKNWWVFFGELQYYIICYMWPYGLANLLFMLLWWAFTGSDIIWPDPLASTPVRLVRRSHAKVLTRRRGAKSAGAIGNARKMTSQNADVILFRPPRITTHSHIHTQVTHKNTTPSSVSLYFNLPEHLQTQEHQLPLPNRPPKHHLAGQEKSSTKIRITSP